MESEHAVQRAIDRIIVAYDGSDLSREAFAYSTMLASAVGCGVLLLHVLETEPTPLPTSIMSRAGAMLDVPAVVGSGEIDATGDETVRMSRQLDELAAYCRLRQLSVEKELASGDLIATLHKRAGTHDLIALGLKGRFASVGPGSTTKKLLNASPCPVMVISGKLHPIMRINLIYDGTAVSERAMRWARQLATATSWPLTVLAVAGVELAADEATEAAAERAPDAMILSVGMGDLTEAHQILSAARHGGFAMYVFGVFPDSWLHQAMFGGTTGRVLHGINHPLVLVT